MQKNVLLILNTILIIIIIGIAIVWYYYTKTTSSYETFENDKKIWALSFGGGEGNFHDALSRISNELTELKVFDKIVSIEDNELKSDDVFWNKHANFIENNKRGYGYWIWKPYIIMKTLEKMNEDDILVYLDSGCEIVNDEKSYNKMMNLIDKCDTYSLLYTLTGNKKEKWFDKMDLLNYMNANTDEIKNSIQHQATLIIIKKTKEMTEFTKEWYEIACNYHFIDDSPSRHINDSEFIEHRHDQSIFSLLTKSEKYKNITYTDNNIIYDSFPILLSRKRNG